MTFPSSQEQNDWGNNDSPELLGKFMATIIQNLGNDEKMLPLQTGNIKCIVFQKPWVEYVLSLAWMYNVSGTLFYFDYWRWKLEKDKREHISPIGWWHEGLADCHYFSFHMWQHFLLLCARKTEADPECSAFLIQTETSHKRGRESQKYRPTQPHTERVSSLGNVPLTTN